jgi:predicted Zn-ribbon and HTH transcriptional regulator
MDQEKRRKMIEVAAYNRSRQKGFTGDPVEDWLEAEKEVDRILMQQQENKEKELAAFKKLRSEMGKMLMAMKGSLKVENFRQALDKAAKEMKEKGEFTSESVNKASEALQKDMARNIEKLQGAWQSVSLKTAGLFSAWSRRGAKFLKEAGVAAESWLKQANEKIKPHTYHTGEITTPGTFVCKSCSHTFKLDETSHLPRCPQCDDTSFKLES